MNKKFTKNFKNIDNKEIDQFNLFAIQWWNTNGLFKSLHTINTIRLDYILKYSNGLFGKIILDVGCGGGLLSESMAIAGAKVIGIDMSINSLKEAESHSKSKNLPIKYVLETIEEHALHYSNYYDIVTCMELLEHVPNPLSVVHACATVVKKGGSVFFSTLNKTFKAWLFAILGAEYILHIIPKGTHEFKKFINPSQLLNWIDKTDLKAKNITGIQYNPFTNSSKLTDNIDINYLLHTYRYRL